MATTLSYSNADFIPFTVIKSADVNQKFTDIKNRLNWDGTTATGLGDDNIQSNTVSGGGLTRSTKLKAGTANYAVYNDANGKLTEAASLPTTAGGLGFVPTINSSNAGKVVGVNDAGSALELRTSEASTLIEQLANNVATLTSGQVLAVNDAVCLDLIDGQYRVMKTDSTNGNRISSFIGFALNTTTATPQITTLTKASSWTTGTETVIVNGRSYSYAYATSNDASMAALAALIGADQDVQSCTVTDNGANDNVITITTKGSLTATISSSASGGAPTFTVANTQTASGSSVRVQMFGPLGGFSSLTVGGYYYIASGTGAISTTPLTNAIFAGQAISTSVLFINPNRFNLAFTTSGIFVRSNGGSTGNTVGNAQSNSEHYDFTSWSSGVDSGISRIYLSGGQASYNNQLILTQGVDTTGTNVSSTKSYNKSSWTSLSAPASNFKAGGGAATLGSYFYISKGSTNTSYLGRVTSLYKYDGASWTNPGSYATSHYQMSTFVVNSKIVCGSGMNADASMDTYDGSSFSTTTASGISNATFGANAPSSKGILTVYDGSSASKTFDGSSYTTVGSIGYTPSGDNATAIQPSGSLDVAGNNTYFNGGSSASTTSITTTSKWNGTSWSTTTASSTARAGATSGLVS